MAYAVNPVSNLGPGAASKHSADVSSYLYSFLITGFVLVGLALATDELRHWFIAPVFLSGVIIGVDAVEWLRGRLGIFDPIGIIGLLGFHFFFLAPLLHVRWDIWMSFVTPPDDWRPWLGAMATLNLAGLLVYRFTRGLRLLRGSGRQEVAAWQIDKARFGVLLLLMLAITGALQVAIYLSYGGISGYISAYSDRYAETEAGFQGLGLLFALSESFPILALIGYVVYANAGKRTRSWIEIGSVLFVFLILKLLFGGLRGSRSNTVWGLFWAVSLIHLFVRPISKKMVLAGLVPFVIFLYAYGFYKSFGSDLFNELEQSNGSLTTLEEESGRTLEGSLLSDLGRADVQAFLFYRLNSNDVSIDFDYAYGRTYAGGLAIAIPPFIMPSSPADKSKWGTNVLHGPGTYESGRSSSRVYGLAGEAMLNFGALAVPFSFAALGFIVGRTRRLFAMWHWGDDRLLIYPLLVNLCFIILVADTDNIVFFIAKNGLLPVALILLSSNFRRREADPRLSSARRWPKGDKLMTDA